MRRFVDDWDMLDVLMWLRKVGLEDFHLLFYFNAVDGKQIFYLNYFDMEVVSCDVTYQNVTFETY